MIKNIVRNKVMLFIAVLCSVTTAVKAGGERDYKRIVAIADIHMLGSVESAWEIATTTAKEALRADINSWNDVDMVVVVGDIVAHHGSEAEYANAVQYLAGFNKPVRVISGNHDVNFHVEPGASEGVVATREQMDANLNKFQTAFNQPAWYWSEEFVGYKLYFLGWDTSSVISSDQMEWLGTELAQSANLIPSIVFYHAPLYGTLSYHLSQPNQALSYAAHPVDGLRTMILESRQLLMWVAGHMHTKPSHFDFSGARNNYEGRVLNVHCSNANVTTAEMFSNSLYLYDDRIEVRTYCHNTQSWLPKHDRSISNTLHEKADTFDFVIETSEPEQTFAFDTDNASLTVEWGDGNVVGGLSGSGIRANTYDTIGVYTVKVSGTASRIAFGGTEGTTPALLRDILTPLSSGVEGITSAQRMFHSAGNITNFTCTSWFDAASKNVTSAFEMFRAASKFNQDLNTWDMGKVTNMEQTFGSATAFNGAIGSWNVSKVTNMKFMFFNCKNFDQDIGGWDVGNLSNMQGTFYGTPFNQDISGWNTENVTTLQQTFAGNEKFNQPIGTWNTSKVTTMRETFSQARAFNQPLDNWDTSKVTSFHKMFQGAYAFDQDLSKWGVSGVTDFTNFLLNATLSPNNYDRLWLKWSKLSLTPSIDFHGGNSKFSEGAPKVARQNVINNFSWEITDGGSTGKMFFWPGTQITVR